MRKPFFVILLFLSLNNVNAFSCGFSQTFIELYNNAEVSFYAKVLDVTGKYSEEIQETCDTLNCNEVPSGNYQIQFEVIESLKGNTSPKVNIEKRIEDWYSMTGGKKCIGLKKGNYYIIVTNEKYSNTGVYCGSCPYLDVTDYLIDNPRIIILILRVRKSLPYVIVSIFFGLLLKYSWNLLLKKFRGRFKT